MKRLLQVVSMGACAVTLFAGCGQKGPLYMPDQATAVVTRPTQTPVGETPPATDKAADTPQNVDSSPGPANPAPEVTPPDKDKKEQGANAPR